MGNPKTYRWLIFALFGLAYMGAFAQRMSMPVLGPELQTNLGYTTFQTASLASTIFYSYAVAILFSGFVATKFGPRITMGFMCILGGLGSILFVSVHTYAIMIFGAILIGLGSSVIVTSGATSFARWFTKKEFANVSSWFFVCGGLGNIMGTGPLTWLVKTFGWQMGYGCVGFLVLIMGVLAFIIIRQPPDDYLPENIQDAQAKAGEPKMSLFAALAEAAKNKNLWCIVGWYITSEAVLYAFNGSFVGPYLKDVYGLERTSVGGILTMSALGFAFGNPILMWLSLNVFHSTRVGITLVNVLALIGIGMAAFFTTSLPYWSLYLVTFFIGLPNAASSIAYAVMRSNFGARMCGPLAGVWSFSTFTAGGILGMIVGGMVSGLVGEAQIASYHTACMLMFFISAAGVVIGLIMSDAYKSTVEAR